MTSKQKLIPLTLLMASIAVTSKSAVAALPKLIEPPMISIPAGEFLMGSDRGREHEKPVHKVSVPAFQMGKYEVTLAEYRKFIEATGYQSSGECLHRIGEHWFSGKEKDGTWNNNIYTSSEFNPVVCVSRIDAVNYAKWLSEETGKHYRLPTEAEWEYAARAGTNTRFFFGDELNSSKACQYGNFSDLHAKNMTPKTYNFTYGDVYVIQPCSDNEDTISVVGVYEPNPFGVYDMLGNVMERLADCYQDSYIGAPIDGSAVYKEKCTDYVVRGGHWHWEALSASARWDFPESFLAALEGFRLVLDTGGKALPSQKGSKLFVKALAAEQAKVKGQHSKKNKYPSTPTGLTLIKTTTNSVKLQWGNNNESFITGYKVYRQDPLTNKKELIARVKKPSFVDKSPLAQNARYSVVALNNGLESLNSISIDSGFVTTHTLPVKIEGEAFSIAEGAEVRYSGTEPETDKIFNALGEKQAIYYIRVTDAGKYQFVTRVFHSGDTQNFEMWLGDKKLASPKLEGNSGWKTLTDISVELPQGTHILSIKGKKPLFAVNWIDVKRL